MQQPNSSTPDMRKLGEKFRRAHWKATGHDVGLYRCERCEDTGFLYRPHHEMQVMGSTPCTCRLQRALAGASDDRKAADIERRIERTERRYLTGELLSPSKAAKVEMGWRRAALGIRDGR